jgi:hypothetical protein
MEIRKLQGIVKATKGTTIHEEYTKHKRAPKAELTHQGQHKLEDIREEFYDTVNWREIQLEISAPPTVLFSIEVPTPWITNSKKGTNLCDCSSSQSQSLILQKLALRQVKHWWRIWPSTMDSREVTTGMMRELLR